MEKDGIGNVVYERTWSIVAGKGQLGTMDFSGVVHTHKKPRNGGLARDQNSFNKAVASQRITLYIFTVVYVDYGLCYRASTDGMKTSTVQC